jgi:hypothetical protein
MGIVNSPVGRWVVLAMVGTLMVIWFAKVDAALFVGVVIAALLLTYQTIYH